MAGRALWLAGVVSLTFVLVPAVEGWVAGRVVPPGLWTWEGQTILLERPQALRLMLVLPLLWLVQLVARTDFHPVQRLLNSALRSLVVAALALALADPGVEHPVARTCSVWVVDTSASVDHEELADVFIELEAAWLQRGLSPMHLVVFGAVPRVVPLPAGGSLPPIPRLDGGDAMASDPARALRLAAGLCPADHATRMVLVHDGLPNRGDLRAEALRAASRGIRIDVRPLVAMPPPDVLIQGVTFPEVVELQAPFVASVDVWSSHAVEARLTVTQNGMRDVQGRRLTLTPGVQRIEVPLEVYEAGERRFGFEVRAEGPDRFPENNRLEHVEEVWGRPQVLYVEGEPRSALPLQRALDRSRNPHAAFDLEVRGPSGMPSTVEEMQPFDVILISDVPARQMSRQAMGALERWVREGGGLLLAGGEDSLGPGGYDNTPLEAMSPVTFDMQRQRDQPSLAILLVIDRSGSMQGLLIEMAKDAARAVVDLLGPQDQVGVIAFDDTPTTVVPLQSAANRTRIRDLIARIGVGGGTDIYPALVEAWALIGRSPARIRHVIVLTDGVAPWDGVADITSTLRADGVTVSSVAVGREADRSLLQMIAELGGGRFHATNDPSNIPQIFVQEATQVARTNLVEDPFRPIVVRRTPAMEGIDFSQMPWLLGWVRTQARPSAEVLLRTESGDPLLARWRLGLGRVVVWTSDVKPRWSVEWTRHAQWPRFWAQQLRDMMRVRTGTSWTLHAAVVAGELVLEVDALDEEDRFLQGVESVVTWTSPSGNTGTLTLEPIAPGRLQGRLPRADVGLWQLDATHRQGEAELATSRRLFTVPWPEEMRSLPPRPEVVQEVADRTGGRADVDPAWLWSPSDVPRMHRQPLWPWVVWALLGLWMLDLLFRRVRMFGLRPVAWARVRAGG
jgi:uncharacterized membrane protein